MKKLALALLATAVLAGCKTSPTGRTQIALYSDQQMSEMGTASFAQMKESQPINKDAKTNAYVNCIAEKVVAVLPKEYASQNWEVVVFEDESANAFALPSDFLRVLKIHNGTTDSVASDMPYKVEGKNIITDEATVYLVYVSKDTDPNNYDSYLYEVLAYQLAADMAYGITNNATLAKNLLVDADEKLREARFVDSVENSTDTVEANEFTDARL